jgi:predicted Fe-S protein YdhL (DUF1289 family)
MSVDSPCIDICKLDDTRSYCTGCLRSLEEIRQWRDMSDGQKRRVIDFCARRRAELERRPAV